MCLITEGFCMKRKDGFTLAEVLITLTIVGVISALTLPAIQSNTSASRNRATLRNTMAILSQAAQNNMATEGWNFAHITEFCDGEDGKDHNSMDNYSFCGLMNSNLTGETYLGLLSEGRPQDGSYRVPSTPCSGGNLINYQLANGAIVGFHANAWGGSCNENKRTSSDCMGYIDVNGLGGPHREIKCIDGTSKHLADAGGEDATCEIERTTNADVFPIVIYDSTVELATDAARAFLNAR